MFVDFDKILDTFYLFIYLKFFFPAFLLGNYFLPTLPSRYGNVTGLQKEKKNNPFKEVLWKE